MTDTRGRPVAGHGGLVAYLQLFRMPNIFTAAADVMMGYLFVRASLNPPAAFTALLVASCLLYTSGMVWNDLFDLERDARQRPERPLPSGRIGVSRARQIAVGMMAAGVALGWLAGQLDPAGDGPTWRSGAVATLLAVCILLYNGVLKATFAGPLAMGACRGLNVLLGMSLGAEPARGLWTRGGYDAAQFLVAAGIGTYIAGVTWFAQTEAEVSRRGRLAWGLGVMLAGILLLALFPDVGAFAVGRSLRFNSPVVWPLLLVLLAFSVVRRCLLAIARPDPLRVQVAVKQCILTLIVLDASICLAVRGPIWALAILALLGPMLLLGRSLPST
jgi:4-hydroxybenzoate polyprenyltransferase